MINGHVWKMEFRRSLKSVVIWGLVFGGYLLLTVVLYPLVKDMYASMPEEMLKYMEMIGGIPENIIEYYAAEGSMLMQLGGAIFVTVTGYSLLGHDEREKTVDAVYSLPVSRSTHFITRLSVLWTEIIIFSAVFLVFFSFAGIVAIERGTNFTTFFRFHLLNTVLFLVFGSIGFSLAALLKRAVKPGLAVFVPLPLYIILLVSQLTDNKFLKNLKYITPYSFADPITIMKPALAEKIPVWTLFGFLFLAAALVAIGHRAFRKKEFFQ
ncbi:MAG: ABC transporter permease subunit [Bacilli bacterium]|jgi:ABC-2 type transport system permease protein